MILFGLKIASDDKKASYSNHIRALGAAAFFLGGAYRHAMVAVCIFKSAALALTYVILGVIFPYQYTKGGKRGIGFVTFLTFDIMK